jgi:hypothetical protein
MRLAKTSRGNNTFNIFNSTMTIARKFGEIFLGNIERNVSQRASSRAFGKSIFVVAAVTAVKAFLI